MAHFIADTCIACGACVGECPTGAISEGDPIYVIDPETCIDCGACADACPVDAIFPADRLGERDQIFIEINAAYYRDNADVSSGWTDVVYPVIPRLPRDLRVAIVGTGPSGGYALRTAPSVACTET